MTQISNESSVPAMTSTSGTHPSLIGQMKANEEAGWTRLVLLYSPLVSAWGRRLGCSQENCEDLCQEVFSVAAQKINTFRADGVSGSFRGWLWRITYRKWIDRYRIENRHQAAAGGSSAAIAIMNHADPSPMVGDSNSLQCNELFSSDPDQELSSPEMIHSLLRRAMKLIKHEVQPSHWQAFWLSAVEGQSTEIVALQLGISATNVRQIRSRILRRLRVVLGDAKD